MRYTLRMKVIVYTLRNQGRKLAESAWRNNPTKPGTMSLSSTTYGERRVEQLTFFETQPNQGLDAFERLHIVLRDKRDGVTRSTSTSSSTHTVNVICVKHVRLMHQTKKKYL